MPVSTDAPERENAELRRILRQQSDTIRQLEAQADALLEPLRLERVHAFSASSEKDGRRKEPFDEAEDEAVADKRLDASL